MKTIRRILMVVVMLIVLMFAFVAVLIGGLIGDAQAGCTINTAGTAGGATAAVSADQRGIARTIIGVGKTLGVPERGWVVAIATAFQESGVKNLNYGDRDSLGVFQQRPGSGWGTPAQIQDPIYSAAAFYAGTGTNGGLLDVKGWQTMPVTNAAQKVQRSGFPLAYAQWEDEAVQFDTTNRDAPAIPLGPGMPGAGGSPGDPGSDSGAIVQAAANGCGPAGVTGGAGVIIAAAASQAGVPYSWGGGDKTGPTKGIDRGANTVGFDHSGLMEYAFAQGGVTLPGDSQSQFAATQGDLVVRNDPDLALLQPGDLLFWGSPIHHVALYAGNGQMWHAPTDGDVVRPANVYDGDFFAATRPLTKYNVAAAGSGGAPTNPVPGARFTSGYGARWGKLHAGIDLAAPLGTPIFAAVGGTVVRAGPATGFGNAIYIQTDNGDVNVYGHMKTMLVAKGAVVQAGTPIALVGNEGQSTGPHLHFEVHVGGMQGTKIDPVPWLAARGVTFSTRV